ncbi:MAG: hypothetical protein IJ458_00040 [Clostridia bacterium]|nr:hypothetical protein [Clostridia bacterium]
MNFDYIKMLTYAEIREFIVKVLTKKFSSNVVVKINNVKTSACAQQVEFELVASNGSYVTGTAYCTDFECKITINNSRRQVETTYYNEWAKWVYSVLKNKNINANSRMGVMYKADYNEHCEKVRDAKRSEAEREFEANLLK